VPAAERPPRLSRQRRLFLIAALAGLGAFVIVAILMRTGALDGLDTWVATLFAGRRRQPFTGLAETLNELGTWWLLILLVAALVGGLWWSGRMLQALYLALSVAAAVIINPILKQVFARPRPVDDPLVTVSSTAFPSGHTTTATTIATALAVIAWPTRWRWPVIAAAAVFSLLMAVSRVYLGVHWPSDVVGGLALGFTIAMTVRLLMPWPSPEETGVAQPQGVAAGPATARAPEISVVFLDWGNTLMVDSGMREGPMKHWEKVEAEAGAQEALLRLRGRYRLVVATNAEDSPAPDVRFALARVGLDEYVDDVITSADVGDHKPNYAFYRAALLHEGIRGLPLDPRRAVMVGDGTTNDIAGAQRAGIRTIWYNPTKRRFPDGAQPPDAVIRKLTDLPAAVDELAGVEPEKRSRRQRTASAAAADAETAEAAAAALRAAAAEEDAAASAAAAIPSRQAASPAPDAPAAPTTGR
jgi:membrane-associated phospholipid phosphatase/phosphoglycolate phosphatase-like HAD superfamily hydrolase